MSTTGWVLLWVALVVGALVFYALIGLHLFRKAQNVFAQAQESTEIFDAYAQALEGIEENTFDTPPALLAGEEEKARWRDARRLNRARRGQRKFLRRKATLRRWDDVLVHPPRV